RIARSRRPSAARVARRGLRGDRGGRTEAAGAEGCRAAALAPALLSRARAAVEARSAARGRAERRRGPAAVDAGHREGSSREARGLYRALQRGIFAPLRPRGGPG